MVSVGRLTVPLTLIPNPSDCHPLYLADKSIFVTLIDTQNLNKESFKELVTYHFKVKSTVAARILVFIARPECAEYEPLSYFGFKIPSFEAFRFRQQPSDCPSELIVCLFTQDKIRFRDLTFELWNFLPPGACEFS